MSTGDGDGHREPHDHTREASSIAGRYATSLTVAAVSLVAALTWAAVAIADLGSDIRDLPRASVPGQLTVEVDEPTGLVVYDERRSWTTPIDDPGVEVEVTGPDGDVAVAPYRGIVSYRWWRTVGQARATFDAAEPGTYEVDVDGEAPADARITVGPSFATSALTAVIGPTVLLVAGLLAAAVLAARRASRTNR